MKPFIASLINASLLIVLGLWSYFGAQEPSFTALIPVISGVVLLIVNPGIKRENKVVAHIAVLLTFLLLIALIKPLTGVIDRNDSLGIVRVVVMQLSCLLAMVYFVKSFIDARKNRLSQI